jgi:hypothetical protein
MSDKIRPVFFEHRAEHPFLGQRLATDSGISDLPCTRSRTETKVRVRLRGRKALCAGSAFDDLKLLQQETVEGRLEKPLGSKSRVVPAQRGAAAVTIRQARPTPRPS